MRTLKGYAGFLASALAALLCLAVPLIAQDSGPATAGDPWPRELKERANRGKVEDVSLTIRGDTGKWRDKDELVHVPSLTEDAGSRSLDDRLDELLEQKPAPAAADDQWLVFRTRQLDDNDRLWVERIERRGNQFTVHLNWATWQGHYNKNFTWYAMIGVNLGKLEPGQYEARWVIRPMEFNKFEDPGRPQNNWPKDEKEMAGKDPETVNLTFAVKAD